MRRLASIPGITFVLFIAWKVLLLLFTAQPVPANDAFFYDGPVVNYILHGKYCNPALAQVLPISGTEVFSAYPPLYQLVLLGWMKMAGTSALAAMWFHVLCLVAFAWIVRGIFNDLGASRAALNWGGLFLFAITFHDRPDTLAHVLGAVSVWTWLRGNKTQKSHWHWLSAAGLLLCFCTSLQIGGIYALWLALMVIGSTVLNQSPIPMLPALALCVVMVALVALVKLKFPNLWAGFQEHLRVTPSVTGWRTPSLSDALKVGRAMAGVFMVGALFCWLAATGRFALASLRGSLPTLLTAAGVATVAALAIGSLVFLTPNTISIANYLQPLVVGSFIAACHAGSFRFDRRRLLTPLFATVLVLVSVRAIGMTTWGALCAKDVSYAQAMQIARSEVESLSGASPVAASSAYLYEVARVSPVRWVHSDWIGNVSGGRVDLEPPAVWKLRPQKIILTQFDYYRRYEKLLAVVRDNPDLIEVHVRNLARQSPPDATPSLQKVLQHISWAPVIVEFSWRPALPGDASN